MHLVGNYVYSKISNVHQNSLEITSNIVQAIDAFNKTLLVPQYIDDFGHRKTITDANEIAPLINRGFSIRRIEERFYLARGLFGGAPKRRFSTTKGLASELVETDPTDKNYPNLQDVASRVIRNFYDMGTKTESQIEEVAALAFARNPVITKDLVKILISELGKPLLEVEVLKALRTTLANASPGALDPDDLVRLLKIVMDQMKAVHQQEGTGTKFVSLVSTAAEILDVMRDTGVVEVDRTTIHDQLNKTLDSLSCNKKIIISSVSAYAKQSLARVPDNESLINYFLKKLKCATQGVSSLINGVKNVDIEAFITSYYKIIQVLEQHEKKKNWYEDIRALKILSLKGSFQKFEDVMRKRVSKYSKHEDFFYHFVGNILFILLEIIKNNSSEKNKDWALSCVQEIYLKNNVWGTSIKLKRGILEELADIVKKADKGTADKTKEILRTIEVAVRNDNIANDLRNIFRLTVDFDDMIWEGMYRSVKASTVLITKAQENIQFSPAENLEQLKQMRLENQDIQKELSCYIPLSGSCHQSARATDATTFQGEDLQDMITEFLCGEDKVFVLFGDSGGGKSTFLLRLEQNLWNNWDPKKPIPLYINLSTLEKPFGNAIHETLTKRNFNKDELNVYKTYEFIFLFDGYDELHKKCNLYEENSLTDWNAKSIVSCRTHYFVGSNYKNFFAPDVPHGVSPPDLKKAFILPFNSDQIEECFKKFIKEYKIPTTLDQYQKYIKVFPNLKEITKNPFILRVIAEVLPKIAEEYKQNKSDEGQLRYIDIFDRFVNNWFDREERRFIRLATSSGIENDYIKSQYKDIATSLALSMVQEKVYSFIFTRKSVDPNYENCETVWDKYFTKKLQHAFAGVPLRKDEGSFRFMHNSLRDYFCLRAIIESSTVDDSPSRNKDEQSRILLKNLNSVDLTSETEILKLMKECVMKEENLKNELFEIIERSKSEVELKNGGANAAAILKAAGVDLSCLNSEGISNSDSSTVITMATNFDNQHFTECKLIAPPNVKSSNLW